MFLAWFLGIFKILISQYILQPLIYFRISPFKVSVFRYYFWDRILAVETWDRLEG